MRIRASIILTVILLNLLPLSNQTATQASAGILDCMKAKGYSKKGVLVKAFNKDPKKKTESDWFNAYTFARLFTGYPKCFDKKDVVVMRKFVSTLNSICSNDPEWASLCLIAKSSGPLAWWVYGNSQCLFMICG